MIGVGLGLFEVACRQVSGPPGGETVAVRTESSMNPGLPWQVAACGSDIEIMFILNGEQSAGGTLFAFVLAAFPGNGEQVLPDKVISGEEGPQQLDFAFVDSMTLMDEDDITLSVHKLWLPDYRVACVYPRWSYSNPYPSAAAMVLLTADGLLSASLDRVAKAKGVGTGPSSGATAMTSQAHELVLGVVGAVTLPSAGRGTWQNGLAAGPRVGSTGGDGYDVTLDLAYKVVTAQAAQTASKLGMGSAPWGAAALTFKAA